MANYKECPFCHGTGLFMGSFECNFCNGTGIIQKEIGFQKETIPENGKFEKEKKRHKHQITV